MRLTRCCAGLSALAVVSITAHGLAAQSYHPTWAPDGARLAYVDATQNTSSIVVLDLRSRAVTRLTGSGARDYYSAWSPDGQRIAFVSERDGNPEIYVVGPDGSELRRLTRDPASDVHPAWSQNGRFLAFDSDRHGQTEVYVVDVETGSLLRVTHNRFADVFPIWSPGDTALLVSSDNGGSLELYSVGLDGAYRGPVANASDHGMIWKTTWSPDGRAVAFACAERRNFDIYLMKVETGRTSRITEATTIERYPVWSPVGDKIAYVSNASGRLEVFYWDLTRWEPVQVTGTGVR